MRGGSFGLANTNKLVRYYDGATGLKTGFTHDAMYCLSATAEREGVEYIAVVLGCATSADRFESAKTLLSWGFSNYTLVSPEPDGVMPIPVRLGEPGAVTPVPASDERILAPRSKAAEITIETELPEELTAPVGEGEELGKLRISSKGETLAEIPMIASCAVRRLTVWDVFRSLAGKLLFGEIE